MFLSVVFYHTCSCHVYKFSTILNCSSLLFLNCLAAGGAWSQDRNTVNPLLKDTPELTTLS